MLENSFGSGSILEKIGYQEGHVNHADETPPLATLLLDKIREHWPTKQAGDHTYDIWYSFHVQMDIDWVYHGLSYYQ